MTYQRVATTCLMLILSSCGGASTDGGSPVVVVPGPTPTIAPTPLPSPSPSASPSPVYEEAFVLSRDRAFAAIGVELTGVGQSPTNSFEYSSMASGIINPADSPTISFIAATEEARLTLRNGAPRIYPGSSISLRMSDRRVYTEADGFFSIAQPGPTLGTFPMPLKYVLLAAQSSTTRNATNTFNILERRFVAGASTLASDVPRTGSRSYRVLLTSASLSGTSPNGFVAQDATLAINFNSGAVSGTIVTASTVSNEPARQITFVITGQLSSTSNRIVGSVATMGNGTGVFAGELYGPAGTEMGLAFSIDGGSEKLIGTVVGGDR